MPDDESPQAEVRDQFALLQDQFAFLAIVQLTDALVKRFAITRQQALNSMLLVLLCYAHRTEQPLSEEPLKAIAEETVPLMVAESWHRLM